MVVKFEKKDSLGKFLEFVLTLPQKSGKTSINTLHVARFTSPTIQYFWPIVLPVNGFKARYWIVQCPRFWRTYWPCSTNLYIVIIRPNIVAGKVNGRADPSSMTNQDFTIKSTFQYPEKRAIRRSGPAADIISILYRYTLCLSIISKPSETQVKGALPYD